MKIWIIFLTTLIASIHFQGVEMEAVIKPDEVYVPNIAHGGYVGPKDIAMYRFMAIVWLKEVFQIAKNKFSSYGHYCGASIINQKYAITTASCMDDKLLLKNEKIIVTKRIIRAGTIRNDDNRQDMDIKSVQFHPDYVQGQSNSTGNICVIEVSCPFTFNNNIQPIKMFIGDVPAIGTKCVASGWGKQGSGNGTIRASFLKQVFLRIGSENYEQIAVYPDTKGGICKGDIGGPLMCNGYLVGIASEGNACSNNTKNPQDKFVSVPYYLPWLSMIIPGY